MLLFNIFWVFVLQCDVCLWPCDSKLWFTCTLGAPLCFAVLYFLACAYIKALFTLHANFCCVMQHIFRHITDPQDFWILTTISAGMIGFALVTYSLTNPTNTFLFSYVTSTGNSGNGNVVDGNVNNGRNSASSAAKSEEGYVLIPSSSNNINNNSKNTGGEKGRRKNVSCIIFFSVRWCWVSFLFFADLQICTAVDVCGINAKKTHTSTAAQRCVYTAFSSRVVNIICL